MTRHSHSTLTRPLALICAAVLGTGALAMAGAGTLAQAAPPSPAPPTTVYVEDFSSGTPTTTPTPVDNYTGGSAAKGAAYYADAAWSSDADACNGWILNAGSAVPSTDAGCAADAGKDGTGAAGDAQHTAWWYLTHLADVLGNAQGLAPGTNTIVASMTNGGDQSTSQPVQLRSAAVIPVTPGHYYQVSAWFGQVHCSTTNNNWNDASESLSLVDGSGTVLTDADGTAMTTTGLDPCTGTRDTINAGTATATPAYVKQLQSDAYLIPSGMTTVAVQIANDQWRATGNDVAFDLPMLRDVTPLLYKEFVPSTIDAGGTSTLTFTVVNTSELSAKTGWSFTDNLPSGVVVAPTPNIGGTCGGTPATAPAGATSIKVDAGSIAAGAANCTVTVDVTSVVPGPHVNATANVATTGLLPPAPATLTVNPPALELTKSVSPAALPKAGQSVTYTFDVKNNSTETLSNLTIDDSTFSGGTPLTITCDATSLAAGASTQCRATYAVTAADVAIGYLTNKATASATDPSNATIDSNESSAKIVGVPVLELVKTADKDMLVAGESVTFSFAVNNTGTAPATGLSIREDSFNGSPALSGITCVPTTLAPGASATCTAAPYTVTAADVTNAPLVNKATATGVGPVVDGTPGTPVASAQSSVSIAAPHPALSVVKAVSPTGTVMMAGQSLTYTVTITNTGNVTLSDVTGTEGTFSGAGTAPVLGIGTPPGPCEAATLAPDASLSCTATYNVTQDDIDAGDPITNTAVASADAPYDGGYFEKESNQVSNPVPTADPKLKLEKYAVTPTDFSIDTTLDGVPVTSMKAGDQIAYLYVFTNTGNVTLTGITFTPTFSGTGGEPAMQWTYCEVDYSPRVALPGLMVPIDPRTDPIPPGAAVYCKTAPYTVTDADAKAGKLTNTATAQASVLGGSGLGTPVVSNKATAQLTRAKGGGGAVPGTGGTTTGTTAGTPVALFALTSAAAALVLARRRRNA